MEVLSHTEKTAQLRERVKELKPHLYQVKGWRDRFFSSHPEYDSVRGADRLKNTLALRSMHDTVLIEALEEIAFNSTI